MTSVSWRSIMHRNTIIAICAGFCAVAVIAGLFISTLSSASKPIGVAQTTPNMESPAVPTTGTLAEAPTKVPATASAATSAPSAAATPAPSSTVPATAVPATAVPTVAPTSVPTSTPAPAGGFIEYTVQRGDE